MEKTKKFYSLSIPKLILPGVFLIFLISVLISTIVLNNQFDKYTCKINTIIKEKNSINQTNTEQLNKLKEDYTLLNEEIKRVIDSKKYILGYAFITNQYISKISPIYPTDCGIMATKFCRFYMSQDSYDCIKNIVDSSSVFGTIVSAKIPEYRPINYFLLILNFIIFTAIAYLISCLISLIYLKLKKNAK